jgi:PAS domain S-box-containing protein/putative nucleotidyltransferase with HDIG domain
MWFTSAVRKQRGEAPESPAPRAFGAISSETETEIQELKRRIAEYQSAAAREGRVEETLRESEERFRQIFEESPLGMAMSDPYFHFIKANRAMCRMLGYSEKELGALTFKEITHPDHVTADADAIKKLLHGEIPSYRTEKRYVRKDGEVVWGALTVSAIRDKKGQFLYFLAMVEDITARKQAHGALAESEMRFRDLADPLPSGVFEIDMEGGLTFANKTACDWFGYAPGELRPGTPVTEFLAEEERERVRASFEKALTGGEASTTEYLARRKDGTTFPVLITARATMKNGRPAGLLGTVVNISERKRGEAALRQSEEYYRSMIEKASDIISVMDLDGTTRYVSPSIERILGYKPEELLGKSGFDLVHPEDLKRLSAREDFAKVLGTPGASAPTVELRDRHKDGSWRYLEVDARSIVDAEGRLAIITNARDVTERKQADLLQNAVYQIARAADESASLDDLYKSVHEIVRTVMPADNFYIALYDAGDDLISFPYFVDEEDVPPAGPEKPGKGLTEYVIRTGKPLLCDDAADRELQRNGEVEVIGAPSAIWLGVPLNVEKKTIGVMVVQHYSDPRAYGPRELRMLEYVSSQVAKSIERKQTEKAVKREWEKLQQYLSIAEVILLVLDTAGGIVMINRKGCRILEYGEEDLVGRNWFEICLRPEERETVKGVFEEIMAGRVEQQEYHENAIVTRSGQERFVAWHNTIVKDDSGRILGTLSSGEDITEHRKAERALAESEELYRRLIAAIPDMIIRTDLKGNILFANEVAVRSGGFSGASSLTGKNIFSFVAPEDAERAISSAKTMFEKRLGPQEINLILNGNGRNLYEINGGVLRDVNHVPYGMVFLCRDIAERKKAETDLQESVKKLRSTLKEAIDSLASAIEMRDPYTAGHQERVTKLASAIAGEMGLEADRIEAIQVAGIIHDIGKLYVPAEILSKPTKLSELEYAMIKMHAQVGFTILSKIDFPWPIAQIVHQHHEYINGSGYPRGLAGKDILLEAKILCVADVVEAMSSHRPYRPALGTQAALDEIAQKRGILFDREVVDACLKLFSEKRFKFE